MAGIRDTFYEGFDVNDPYAIMNYYFYTNIKAKKLSDGELRYYYIDTRRDYHFSSSVLSEVLHERDVCIRYDGDLDLIVEDDSPNIYESMDLPPFPKNKIDYDYYPYKRICTGIFQYHNQNYVAKFTFKGKRYCKTFEKLEDAVEYMNKIKK